MNNGKRKLVAVIENHFDQIWRRRFKGDFVWRGLNYVSYEKIEKYVIEKNLEIAKRDPDYKFQIENTCCAENYIATNPERADEVKKLYADGVIKTDNTGYAILDSNFVSAEAIIRNYLLADEFFAKYMGYTPRVANRSDAFGNSAQLPQILKAFGADYVTEIYYNPYDDDVWVGIDGSALCVKKHAKVGVGGGWMSYPVCPECKGFGNVNGCECNNCQGKGIDIPYGTAVFSDVKLRETTDSGVFRVGGEEIIPSDNTTAQIKKLAAETGLDISIGHREYLLELYKDEIRRINAGDYTGLKVRSSPEFNPNTTGGYVTRIKIKQNLRECENKLLAGETIEAMRMLCGEKPFSYGKEWRSFMLCGFHDSAYGTVVDQAYDEIMELFDGIKKTAEQRYLSVGDKGRVKLFNPTSAEFNGVYDDGEGNVALVNGLKPYSCGEFEYEPEPKILSKGELKSDELVETVLTGAEEKAEEKISQVFSIENEYLRIDADSHGIRSVTDKRIGTLCETIDGVRPFGWIIQSDTGSAWATLEPPYITESLASSTELVCTEKTDNYVRIRYKTTISNILASVPMGTPHLIEWSVSLFKNYPRVKFNSTVRWNTASRRLMMSFPVPFDGRDIYGIPGGWLEREQYEPDYSWNGANGDHPAYRYAGVEGQDKSVAVFNSGTPSYKIDKLSKGKVIYISVLRSPCVPVCLESGTYTMSEIMGMRDRGVHSFEFELAGYGEALSKSSVAKDSESFYRPLLPIREGITTADMPYVTGGHASVTHVKPAEDGNGIIVRVTEHGGENGYADIHVPSWVKRVERTNLPENKSDALALEETIRIELRAFELATLRFII